MQHQEKENILSPDEIDTVIDSFYQTKQEIKRLEEKHDEYKQLLNQLINNTTINIIKGKHFHVKRFNQKRRYIDKNKLPEDLFEKYSTVRHISVLTVKSNNIKVNRSRSRSRSRTKN